MKKNIKKIIIVLIIIILIIVAMIISIVISEKGKQNKESEQRIEEQQSVQKMVADNESNKIKNISYESEYFNAKNCIDNYKATSNYIYYSKQYESLPENEKQNVEQKKTQLLGFVPEFVKQKLNLEENNVYDVIGLPDKEMRIDNVYVSTQKVKAKEGDIDNIYVKAYITSGVFIDRDSLKKERFNIIVLMDTKNDTFLIVPQKYIEQENIDIKEGSNLEIYDKGIIENKEYNKYTETMETEETMSKEYFNRLRQNLINDPAYIYSKLDDEYKKKRFESYENFTNYIKEDKDNLNKIKLKSYLVNRNEDNTEYVCKDQYENLYTFEQTSPLNFTLKLDTYTIATEKFKETYNNAENYKKVQMNIDKFFQMINRQDYKTAYSCLAQSYKNNYFKTEDEFVKFAKSNFFTYNKVTYLGYEQKGSKLYTFNIRLSDKTEENTDTKDIKIIMQLNEDLDFEMSFSME